MIKCVFALFFSKPYTCLKHDDGDGELTKTKLWAKNEIPRLQPSITFQTNDQLKSLSRHIISSLSNIILCSSDFDIIQTDLVSTAKKSNRLRQNLCRDLGCVEKFTLTIGEPR